MKPYPPDGSPAEPGPLARNPLARDPRIPAATGAIKGWTRSALRLEDDAVVTVSELACSRPDCPPRETVVMVMRPGNPARHFTIHKAIVDIGEQDVIDAGPATPAR